MTQMKKVDDSGNAEKVESRRNFLKLSAVSAAGAAGAATMGVAGIAKAAGGDKVSQKSFSLFRREHDRIEDINEISPDFKRMDQKNMVFARVGWDPKIQHVLKPMLGKKLGFTANPMEGNRPGFGQLEHALAAAANAGHDAGTDFSALGQRGGGVMNNWETHTTKINPHKHSFKNGEDANRFVVRAAKFLGASDAGIAPYDERWTYSHWYDPTPMIHKTGDPTHEKAEFPFEVKSVISVVSEMDYEACMALGGLNDAAVMKGYSEMAEVTHKIAVFLNQLGYKAIPAGNDTGLSIPIAVQAGMGELSRMGTLINEKYGSRVRLSKVYTDLEMTPNAPVTFGVHEFCKKCKKCADSCPSNSISLETEPTWEPKTGSISSHPGVKKWFQNNETCLAQWEKFGIGCGICFTVCPYNKLDTWVHDVAKLAVGIPIGRDIARQLDDMFGYGAKPEHTELFWNSEG